MSLRPVSYLVPLELDCHDNERNNTETEMVSGYQEASFSEADDPPTNELESTLSRHEAPIHLGIDSPASGPNESPPAQSAVMHLSGLEETHRHETADTPSRDSESQPLCTKDSALPCSTMEPRAEDSPQPPSEAQNEEHNMQRQPSRAAIRQQQLLQELLKQDLL